MPAFLRFHNRPTNNDAPVPRFWIVFYSFVTASSRFKITLATEV
jgi:hypothetical protein